MTLIKDMHRDSRHVSDFQPSMYMDFIGHRA